MAKFLVKSGCSALKCILGLTRSASISLAQFSGLHSDRQALAPPSIGSEYQMTSAFSSLHREYQLIRFSFANITAHGTTHQDCYYGHTSATSSRCNTQKCKAHIAERIYVCRAPFLALIGALNFLMQHNQSPSSRILLVFTQPKSTVSQQSFRIPITTLVRTQSAHATNK